MLWYSSDLRSAQTLKQRVLACRSLDERARTAVADDEECPGFGEVYHRGATPVLGQPAPVEDVPTLRWCVSTATREPWRAALLACLIPEVAEL